MSIGKYYYAARFVTLGGTNNDYVMGDGTLSTGTGLVKSNETEGGTGSVAIGNMVKITQSDYTALGTPDADTFYVIVG